MDIEKLAGQLAEASAALSKEEVLSQRDLAEKAQVHEGTILRLELGKGGAHPRTIRKLATVLGVEPKALRADR